MARPTIYSIARELGLHASTVSRAFNRPEMVRAEVRDRVLAHAAAVNYHPNAVARGLITGRTGLIGLLIPDIENPFFAPLVRAIQAAADRRQLQVLLMDSELSPTQEPALIGRVRDQVDGFILASPRRATADLIAAAAGTPHVLVNRRDPDSCWIDIDHTEALVAAADHLVSLGHQRIALLRGPSQSWAAEQRRAVVRQWAETAPAELVEIGPFEALFDGGVAAAAQLPALGVSAVLAFDDLMACGVVAGLSDLGLSVPDDLSVVGCDDVLLASTSTPALTTIRAPYADVGEAALEALLAAQADEPPLHTELPGRLVVRASTAAPRAR